MDHLEAHLKREGLPMLRSAGRTYPSVRALLTSLDWLEKESVVVLRLGGLRFDGASVTGSIEHIADFSSLEGSPASRSQASIEAARGVLGRWDGDVQFVDVRLKGRDTAPRDAIVTVAAGTVLALVFVYLVLSALFSNWGP
jgi:hypothetical protein